MPTLPDDAAVIVSYNLHCEVFSPLVSHMPQVERLIQGAAGTEAFQQAPRLARQRLLDVEMPSRLDRWHCRIIRQLLA